MVHNLKLSANNRRRKDFFKLPIADQKLLEELGYKSKLAEVDKAIIANAAFVRQMVAQPQIFSDADLGEEEDEFDGAADEYGEPGTTQLLHFFTLNSNAMQDNLILIVTLMIIPMTTSILTRMTTRYRTQTLTTVIRTRMSSEVTHPQRSGIGQRTSTWTS